MEEVRLLDDRSRLCGTILQFVLERYDVPKRFDECQPPTVRSCTFNLPNETLGILNGRSDWNPNFVHRLCKIHSGDNIRHDQKDVRLGERLAGARPTTEPKHSVNLASGFRVHLSPEPLGNELLGFRVQFFIPRDSPVIAYAHKSVSGMLEEARGNK